MHNKNNNKNSEKTPSLDLSFAYGTAVMKQLTQRDIAAMAEKETQEAAVEASSTGDTTIRSVTSLFAGTRRIVSLGLDSEEDDET